MDALSKNDLLNKLFDEWENAIPHYKGKFVRNGILCEEVFEKQKLKILFLCKESNNLSQIAEDFRENFGGNSFRANFKFSISEWAYGLLNNFPLYDTINMKKRIEALKCIAFMNLKKISGKSVSNRKELEQHINHNKEFLKRQISIIAPDVIIGSVTHFNTWQLLFDTNHYFKTGHGIKYVVWDNIPIIDFYHPSMRSGRAPNYALLKLVFETHFDFRKEN